MKWMGTVFLAVGSFLLWQKRVLNERRKTKALKEMVQAVSFMAGEIRCSLAPVPKLILHCAERCRGDAGEFFSAVGKKLGEEVSLQKAWEEALPAANLPDGSAKDALAALGGIFRYDEEAVVRHLTETEVRLKEEVDARRREQKEKEKLWAVFCASGAGLIWLLTI
ncbi:MAG: stage III sporulation protein AB [Oscillospiraceae bacterium]|nr:stage III sporulation protein AB [Oscillospiraceae bacterium]